MQIDFGYSPCPNDTFMFWGWIHQQLDSKLSVQPHLDDIQRLNRLALESQPYAFTKVSMGTYLDPRLKKHYRLLDSGAALGRGCGPLVVSGKPWSLQNPGPLRLAVPGRDTTACKLAEMALGEWVEEWVELRYDQIMPAVLSGESVDAGVIIHESRFVYQDLGLRCALDLGDWWERGTGLPLPLGLMVARRDLDEEAILEAERALRDSVALARATIDQDTKEAASLWDYMRRNAIELDDEVMRSHVQLYVNDFSLSLGPEGRAAIEEFEQRATASVSA